jgi:hypothetical protein
MGCFDIYCIICGNSAHSPSIKIPQCNTSWLDKCTILLSSGVIHDCEETGCSVEFTDKKGQTYFLDTEKGLFLHTNCFRFVKKHYGVSLTLASLPSKQLGHKKYKAFPINYGDIEKYWRQDFLFDRVVADGKSYYLCNPLTNEQNAKRIMTIIDQLIKKM